MDSWIYVIALCLFTVLPGVLFAVFWWYMIKRGWGSRWLLAVSITILVSLMFIIISLAAQEKSILFLGVAVSVLGGILFYIYLRTSPLSDALIGKHQIIQSNPTALNEEEKNSRKDLTKVAVKKAVTFGFLQILPLIIGLAILVLSNGSKSEAMTSLALFVMGFYGILSITLRPKYGPANSHPSKGKLISGILITAFAWSLALYSLVKQ
jgi:hypothetical protein